MPELQPYEGYYLWLFIPNLGASIFFVVAFAAAIGYNAGHMFATRSWYCIPMIVGGLFEFVGYIGRAVAYNDTGDLTPYAIWYALTLLAPALFSATIYMALNRVIRAEHAETLSLIPVRWSTPLFVSGDVASFVVQAAAAGLMVSGDATTQETGQHIGIAGICIQIVMFGLFVISCAVFHQRFKKTGRSERDVSWQTPMHMLYAVSALILIRSVYRVVEFSEDGTGYLWSNEWPFMVFDSTLMLLTMLIFAIWHPCRYVLPKKGEKGLEAANPSSSGPLE